MHNVIKLTKSRDMPTFQTTVHTEKSCEQLSKKGKRAKSKATNAPGTYILRRKDPMYRWFWDRLGSHEYDLFILFKIFLFKVSCNKLVQLSISKGLYKTFNFVPEFKPKF